MMKKFFTIFNKESKKDETLEKRFRSKYLSFQDLLVQNNNVLMLMADMQEKLSGEYLFDRHYIDESFRSISDGVLKIIKDINDISNEKYMDLYKIHQNIDQKIHSVLYHRAEIPVSDLVVPIDSLFKEAMNIAGGKITHLGEIRNRIKLPTPEGFSITAYAFKKFMEHNRLNEKINGRLSMMDINNYEEIASTSKEIQEIVAAAEIPDELQNSINKAVDDLKSRVEISSGFASRNSEFRVSVRSSAILEDGEFSFAGQYATFLNVPEGLIHQRYKEVIASLFTQRAIYYYKTKGFSEEEMIMAVGVLNMIDAKAAGVIYTRDPNDPGKDHIIINAAYGLGKSVVEGVVTPEFYLVSRQPGGLILERSMSEQKSMFIGKSDGTVEESAIPEDVRGKQCITDEMIKTLSEYALEIEKHYGCPQDIEWVVDKNDRPYILQSRALQTLGPQPSPLGVPRKVEGYNILISKGIIACKGIGFGKAYIVKTDEDLKSFPEGAILVARNTSTKFVTVMNKASAIITDIGGTAGHMAALTREFNVPTILDTDNASTLIRSGQELTVDAINCNVYEGRIDRLVEYAAKKEPFKETVLFRLLEKGLKWVVPLNLADPEDDNFKPESCITFHDITRIAHEKAMQEMFMLGEGHDTIGVHTTDLKAGIPLNAHLLDIEGGLKQDTKKATPADIASIPFSAFLSGMTKAKWPEPRPPDVRGFMEMMAHTATIPEEQLHQTAERSFALISGNYMNFSIRLGYHFSMVEAYAGESLNDNYIRFFFKGGGAAVDRRLRRVRLITEIIKRMDFKVKVTGDVIDAMLAKYRQADIEKKLEIMGKLTAYTKQLDMALFNDDVTDMFIEDFISDNMDYIKQ